MIYCSQCGKPNPDGAITCNACGAGLATISVNDKIEPVVVSTAQPALGMHASANATSNIANVGNVVGLIGALLVIAGFFLSWINFAFTLSGYDVVFGPFSNSFGSNRYLLLIPPISAFLFLCVIFSRKFQRGLAGFLKIVPLLAIIVFIIVAYIKQEEKIPGGVPSKQIADFIEILGIGVWSTLIGAIAMCFHKSKR